MDVNCLTTHGALGGESHRPDARGPGAAPVNLRAADAAGIADAALRLARGQTVAFPTETVYGLGADAASATGVASIYRIKGRPADHPLIVHVRDVAQARWWGEFDECALMLAAAFWPGPLTLIVRRREGAPVFASAGESTIGLRCPAHPVASALLDAFTALGGHGIAGPSANRFGRVSPTCAAHVAQDLGGDVPLILDGGACEVGVESTIVDVSRGVPVLLRPGGIAAGDIARVLGQAPHAPDAQAPRASGTLAAHYAPRTPMSLVSADGIESAVRACASAGLRAALWSRQRPDSSLPGVVRWQPQPHDPEDFARQLYDTLRRLDALGLDRVLVERVPQGPGWDAVRDRLGRAAATFEDAR